MSKNLSMPAPATPQMIVAFDIGKKNFAFVVEELVPIDVYKKLPIVDKKNRYIKSGDPDLIGTPTPEFTKTLEQLYQLNKIILVSNNNLTECTAPCATAHATAPTSAKQQKQTAHSLDETIFINMYKVLDRYSAIWDKHPIILIEKQMSFGTGKQNTMAMKLAQHCYSYFIYKYRGKVEMMEFPATKKTQLLGAPKHFGTITKVFKNGKSREIKDNRKKWSARVAIDILTKRADQTSLDLLEGRHERKQQQDDLADCLLMCEAFCLERFI